MREIVNQVLHFLQTGIAAIFHFVEMIWDWSTSQVIKLTEVPWQQWPILKVLLLLIVVAAVIWALYKVVWELWLGAERVLSAFAGLLVIFVHTLPRVLMAGVIALGGVWVMNHLDNSMMRVPSSLLAWQLQPQQSQQPQQPQTQQK